MSSGIGFTVSSQLVRMALASSKSQYSPIDYVICRYKLQIQWHRALRDKDSRSLGSAMAYTIDEYLTHRNFWTRDVLVKEALVLLGCADKSIVYGMLDEDVRVLVESVLEILELGAAGLWDPYGAVDCDA
jgi:hypothetical protein